MIRDTAVVTTLAIVAVACLFSLVLSPHKPKPNTTAQSLNATNVASWSNATSTADHDMRVYLRGTKDGAMAIVHLLGTNASFSILTGDVRRELERYCEPPWLGKTTMPDTEVDQ
jgi:hypothetical protein